jgi:ribonuclease J
MIPGNERSIGRTINRLFRQGANVIHEKVSEIHVSGHASKEELKLMLNMVRPRYFMPIHGEYRHLVNHARLGRKQGIPQENIFVMENGDILRITEDGAALSGKAPSGRVYIDGKGVGDVEEMVLRDRRRLGQDGIVLVLITIEKDNGRLVSPPDVISRGFILEDEYQDVIAVVKDRVTRTIEGLDREITSDPALLKDKVRTMLKKHFRNTMERMPMIMPLVFEV